MKQRIINVIERIDCGNLTTQSFILPHKDDNQHPFVNDAEQLFLSKAKENGCTDDDDDILDSGYYENGTYELYLTWSE